MALLLRLGCSLLALSTCLLPRARADCGRDCAACAYRLGPRADIHPLVSGRTGTGGAGAGVGVGNGAGRGEGDSGVGLEGNSAGPPRWAASGSGGRAELGLKGTGSRGELRVLPEHRCLLLRW